MSLPNHAQTIGLQVIDLQVIVIAKAPAPGQAKTRLTPPCSPEQAGALAAAALADTLDTVRELALRRCVVAFDGDPRHPQVDLRGFDVLPQRGVGLGQRLANAFADAAAGRGAGLPTLLIGMDTPQLDAEGLAGALTTLQVHPAVLGPAADGGWWALGLREPRHAAVLSEVPMSLSDTGRRTEQALWDKGLPVVLLPELRDVDTVADAHLVAAVAPGSRFARTLAAMQAEPVGGRR